MRSHTDLFCRFSSSWAISLSLGPVCQWQDQEVHAVLLRSAAFLMSTKWRADFSLSLSHQRGRTAMVVLYIRANIPWSSQATIFQKRLSVCWKKEENLAVKIFPLLERSKAQKRHFWRNVGWPPEPLTGNFPVPALFGVLIASLGRC